MSDKFFFKGRQDARQSHINNFQPKVVKKAGSKKFPINLVVKSDERKNEIQQLLNEANLHGNIKVDVSDDAIESIDELTILLNKTQTVKVEQKPSRNAPCVCGSGKKYKKCCASS